MTNQPPQPHAPRTESSGPAKPSTKESKPKADPPPPGKTKAFIRPTGKQSTGKQAKTSAETSDPGSSANAYAREDAERERELDDIAERNGWPKWAPRYLEELIRNCGQKGRAIGHAGKSHNALCDLRGVSTSFVNAERRALEQAKDVAEDEARRRAVTGVVTMRTIMPDGRIIEKIEYSDQILLRLLERLESGSWRQKLQIEQPAPGVFNTRAERKAHLDKMRAEIAAEDAAERARPLCLPTQNATHT